MSRTVRRPKRGSKARYKGCRNNGPCERCRENRTRATRMVHERSDAELGGPVVAFLRAACMGEMREA